MGFRLVSFNLQILVAALALLTVSSQYNRVLGSAAAGLTVRTPPSTLYDERFSAEGSFANGWRTHHFGDEVVSVSNKLSAERRRDDRTATSRRQLLQPTSTPSAEVEALMAFKEGVINDPLGVLNSWNSNDSDACHWRGVACAKPSNTIVRLDLGSFGLMGTISPLLGRLTNLQTLQLSDNFFNGEIPTSLFNCSRLSYIALRNNNLRGHIPSQVGDLLQLQSLDLGYNDLVGFIPASLSNCSSLRLIHLDFTNLTGQIPPSLGQLAHLESLNLTATLNNGTIPKSLGNCSYLTTLEMGNVDQLLTYAASNSNLLPEELSGQLPAELGKLKRLKTLGISGTSIRGEFPLWIRNFTALTSLTLAFNSFSGEIPEFLGSLPLEYLFLLADGFSGAIPTAISNCTNLWLLKISRSPNVSGTIPAELGMLSKLGSLDLAGDSLTGRIPASLSNCSALRVLALGGNPLLDPQPVPSWVASLVNLTYLYMAAMNLQGEIPIAFGELAKLDHLWLWGNRLSGVIPASLGNCTSLVHLELQRNQSLDVKSAANLSNSR